MVDRVQIERLQAAKASGGKLYIIDYFAAGDERPSDCYPDFCYSHEEAERIAPVFALECDWIDRWEIREEDAEKNE